MTQSFGDRVDPVGGRRRIGETGWGAINGFGGLDGESKPGNLGAADVCAAAKSPLAEKRKISIRQTMDLCKANEPNGPANTI
jgi:hypothetical protein